MANTYSAKKMGRKIIRRTQINRRRVSQIRTLIRAVEIAVLNKDVKQAEEGFKTAQPHIMRGADKHIFHKNKAARMISNLAKKIAQLKK